MGERRAGAGLRQEIFARFPNSLSGVLVFPRLLTKVLHSITPKERIPMAAKYLHYSYDQLNTFCMDAFQKFGFSESEARIISDVLLLSDLYGIESHGMQRLVRYHKGIEKGMIDVHAKPEIVHETPVSAVIDAHDAMGQLVSHQAMELAIEKAKKTGMAIVSVRNSNHFGIAGYYAKMACDQGLVGMAMTNSEAIMVPTYARMAMIGSNPIALAVPAEP